MRKFLSILMLACLLLGMVLPVAAEGEQPLYALVGEETDFQPSLSFYLEDTLTVRFYKDQTEEGLITDATFTSDKEGLTVEGPGEGGIYTLSATAADTYTISCELEGRTYQMGVEVREPETPSTTNTIPVPDATKLREILSSQENFDAFIGGDNPDGLIYSGSGDLTLQLPAGEMGSVTCGVQLAGGAKLILEGAADKKTIIGGLSISVPNVSLNGIKFSDSVTVAPGCKLAVSDCAFTASGTKSAFRLIQDSNGNVSKLSLTANSYTTMSASSKNFYAATILKPGTDSSDVSVVGTWLAQAGSGTDKEEIDFGVSIRNEEGEALHITFPSSKASHVNRGWNFSFITNCDYKDAYVVYSRKRASSSLDTKKKQITIGGLNKGEYIVVNGSYPKLEKKSSYYEVKVTEKHKYYLDEITLENFPYAAANITLGGKSVDYTMKTVSGKRTVTIPKLSDGTYVIKETTKTVTKTTTTKTTTTSRKYSTTYQDYFLITPQGFSNAVRYVKDNLVTLNCTEAGRKPISLPVASMRAAAEKGYSVLVKTKNYELTLDAAALKSVAQQAKGTTVLLHYKSLNHVTMSDVGQDSVKSHIASHAGHIADLAFLVTATSESEQIEDLQQGSIQLKIPFIILPGTEDRANEVYALQSDTVTEARKTDVADGYLTTTLLDLTEHMVFQIGDPSETTAPATEPTEETTEETEEWETEEWETEEWETEEWETEEWETEDWEDEYEEDTGGGLLRWVLIILGGMLAVVCGVLGFVFLRRRKTK